MPERRAESAANLPTVRQWANQVFSRASGAPLREGNQITLLKDASENYSAWLTAIGDARQTIDFEMYIIHEDEQGQRFADALLRQGSRRRSGSPAVRLDGRVPEDVGAILESPARRRHRRSLLQPAAVRPSTCLAQPRPSEDDHGRQRDCLRHGSLCGSHVDGRSRTSYRPVA